MGLFSAKPVAAPTQEDLVAQANQDAADAVGDFHRAADRLDRAAATLLEQAVAAEAVAASKTLLASDARSRATQNSGVAQKIRNLVS